VSRCLEAIQQATATMALPQPLKSEGPSSSGRRASSSSATVPRSPTGVLDAGCLSYRRAAAAAASHASSSWRDEDDDDCPPAVCSKRRKISR
jgi:cyclin D1/2/4, plant